MIGSAFLVRCRTADCPSSDMSVFGADPAMSTLIRADLKSISIVSHVEHTLIFINGTKDPKFPKTLIHKLQQFLRTATLTLPFRRNSMNTSRWRGLVAGSGK